jgi:hypothetical protein
LSSEAEPVLPELIRRALDSRLADVWTAAPGIVVDYSAATQTATVRLGVNRTIPDADGEIAAEELPPIPNVPVQWPRTSTFSITSRLASGDTVLLVFNRQAPTEWRRTGEVSTPADQRLHGIGYPVAIPGYLPNPTEILDTDDSIGMPGALRVHFTPETVKVGDGTDFVAMTAKVMANFNTLSTALAAAPGGPIAFSPVAVGSSNLKAD